MRDFVGSSRIHYGVLYSPVRLGTFSSMNAIYFLYVSERSVVAKGKITHLWSAINYNVPVVKNLLLYSLLILLEKEYYEEKVQPYRKMDYKLMLL